MYTYLALVVGAFIAGFALGDANGAIWAFEVIDAAEIVQ